jgi:hypothetical protein
MPRRGSRILRAFWTLACLSLFLSGSGCATLSRPQRTGLPYDQRDGIDVGCFICDVLFTGGIGLLFDFIHGTIYRPKENYSGPGSDPKPQPKRGEQRSSGDRR